MSWNLVVYIPVLYNNLILMISHTIFVRNYWRARNFYWKFEESEYVTSAKIRLCRILFPMKTIILTKKGYMIRLDGASSHTRSFLQWKISWQTCLLMLNLQFKYSICFVLIKSKLIDLYTNEILSAYEKFSFPSYSPNL